MGGEAGEVGERRFGRGGSSGSFGDGALDLFFKVAALRVELRGEQIGILGGHVVDLLARDRFGGQGRVGGVWVVAWRRCGKGSWQIDEFAVGFVLDEPVDVPVACVVPDGLRGNVHGVAVACGLVVCKGVGLVVASAACVTADQADPQVR